MEITAVYASVFGVESAIDKDSKPSILLWLDIEEKTTRLVISREDALYVQKHLNELLSESV